MVPVDLFKYDQNILSKKQIDNVILINKEQMEEQKVDAQSEACTKMEVETNPAIDEAHKEVK